MTFSRVNFEITNRCNLSCAHCLRERSGEVHDLPPELIDRVLRQAREAYGVQLASLTGGEPLLHPRFESILESLVAHDYRFSFVTNGLLLQKRLPLLRAPEVRKHLISVAVSLDGPDAATHDRIRGAGNFKKTMAGILGLKAAGIPFVIKYTLGRHNLDSLEAAVLAMSHLEAERMEIAHMHPTPDNVEAGLLADPADWRRAEAVIYRLGRELKMPVALTSGLYSPQSFFSCSSLAMVDLFVDCKGRLCLCCQLPGIRGRDPAEAERDVVAPLADTDLWDAHSKLIAVINGFQRHRLKRIAAADLHETDRFQCIACASYFGKLDWLASYPQSPWCQTR
jgi:MoaA/NifB/PqqE/SkfB family radical SAM enzyme